MTGIHQLTAAYALDALDPVERHAYEAHLPECASCRNELEAFSRTTEALAVAASGPAPDAGLRDRILAQARAEPHVVLPFERRGTRRLVPALAAVAAAAAIVAAAVGLWAAQLSSDLDDARSALESERAAAAVLADPAARTIALAVGSGRLVVDGEGRAVLVLSGLDPAPAGKAYETWVVRGDTPERAGLFAGRDGPEIVRLEREVSAGDVVAVTLEDDRGADAPTSAPIVASEPV